MKLNYDCIRDVLLRLEEKLTITEDLEFIWLSLDEVYSCSKLSEYDRVTVFYAIYKLNEAGYLNAHISSGSDVVDDCLVIDITYEGHEFLQSIKPADVWNKVKHGCSKIGTISIPIITQVASKVISSLIAI